MPNQVWFCLVLGKVKCCDKFKLVVTHPYFVRCVLKETNSETDGKRHKLEETNGNLKKDEKPSPETEDKTTQVIVWPEPLPRSSQPVRTLVASPTDEEVSLPEACQLLREISQTATEEAQRIWFVEQRQINQ